MWLENALVFVPIDCHRTLQYLSQFVINRVALSNKLSCSNL